MRFLLFLCACSALTGCTPSPPMTTASLPTPPFGTIGRFNGGYETRTSMAMSLIDDTFGEAYGPIQFDHRREVLLNDAATWPQIEAFYDSAFAQPPLDAFTRQPVASAQPDRYQIAMWRDGDETLGVTMVLGKPGDPLPFLFLFGTSLPDDGAL